MHMYSKKYGELTVLDQTFFLCINYKKNYNLLY